MTPNEQEMWRLIGAIKKKAGARGKTLTAYEQRLLTRAPLSDLSVLEGGTLAEIEASLEALRNPVVVEDTPNAEEQA